MINLAVTRLQEKLQSNLGFLDLVGGVAHAQKIKIGEQVRTLPATPDPENPDGYIWLTPDSARSGIAYFEVLRSERPEPLAGGNAYIYRAAVRCVVWLNTARLSPKAAAPVVMAMVASQLQGRYDDAYPVTNIRVTPEGEAVKSPELFGKYTYNEAESQFLMLPFEYFAFDFALSFALISDCPVTNIVKIDAVC